jgi:hypothetical protein
MEHNVSVQRQSWHSRHDQERGAWDERAASLTPLANGPECARMLAVADHRNAPLVQQDGIIE